MSQLLPKTGDEYALIMLVIFSVIAFTFGAVVGLTTRRNALILFAVLGLCGPATADDTVKVFDGSVIREVPFNEYLDQLVPRPYGDVYHWETKGRHAPTLYRNNTVVGYWTFYPIGFVDVNWEPATLPEGAEPFHVGPPAASANLQTPTACGAADAQADVSGRRVLFPRLRGRFGR